MRIIIQIILLFSPTFINAQSIINDYKFIEDFDKFYRQFSIENGDWSEYKNKKHEFDNKLNKIILNKELLIKSFNIFLSEQENIKLKCIIEKYSNTNIFNSYLKSDLLDWKISPIYCMNRNSIYNYIRTKNFLTSEGVEVITNSEDPFSDIPLELNYLAEQEEISLKYILKMNSNGNYNDNLLNELLNWKLNPKLCERRDAFLLLLEKLDYLMEESKEVDNNIEDPVNFLLFHFTLEEIVEILDDFR